MSDHFSGPRAIAGPAGDICDFYAFPSPQRPERLVLVLTVHPFAQQDTPFSPNVECGFRLRPTWPAEDATVFEFGPESEDTSFTVTFDAPVPGAAQTGRCVSGFGEDVALTVGDEDGAHAKSFSVYAGLRSDPFFIDLAAFQKSWQSGTLALDGKGTNSLQGANVLTVVVEVDTAVLAGRERGSLFAAVGETRVAGGLPVRLERTGRPELKNVMLQWKNHDPVNRDIELRDLYNLEDAFHMSGDYRPAYRTRLNANLAALDRIDGTDGWRLADGEAHPLTEILLLDHLVIDVDRPYAEDSYFEIEKAVLAGRPHRTCGGRSLNDPVMDTIYSTFIGGPEGFRISDGVSAATAPAGLSFPYLAPANAPQPPA
ncbi:DUF4331 family protein [Streptomyces sp. NPDC047061]|uniref:DUF4331 family protein n=1 Tax=Streptomyces sp. NPDC047061 TaxID=3154605 RepID=UPI003407C6A9